MTAADGLVEVHLRELPVPLWAEAQQRGEELLREFALIAAGDEDVQAHHPPVRLTELIAALTVDFEGVSTAQELELSTAAAKGQQTIADLTYLVPDVVAPACQRLGDLLDEADDYCRAGQHLLTLAATPQIVAFRRWYLVEFIRQVAGGEPVPWPRYDGYWPAVAG